jgi:hypothetical protein
MGVNAAYALCLLVLAPSLLAIYSAMRSNSAGQPRSPGINAVLAISVLGGLLGGSYLLFLAATILQIKTFVTFAGAIFIFILSLLPLLVAYWALRALNGAELRSKE